MFCAEIGLKDFINRINLYTPTIILDRDLAASISSKSFYRNTRRGDLAFDQYIFGIIDNIHNSLGHLIGISKEDKILFDLYMQQNPVSIQSSIHQMLDKLYGG